MGGSESQVAGMTPSTEDVNDEKMGQGRNEEPCRICGRVHGNGVTDFLREEMEERQQRLREGPFLWSYPVVTFTVTDFLREEMEERQQRLREEARRRKEANEEAQQLLEPLKKGLGFKEISVIRLSLAVNQMSKKGRDKVLQRVLEARDPGKDNWSHRSEDLHQQQIYQYQQDQREQYDQKQNQGQDLPHQGQNNKQPNQRQNDRWLNQGQKDQQNQQLRQGQQDQQQQEDQQSMRGQKDQNRQQGYVPVFHGANYNGYGIFGTFIWLLVLLPPLASSQCSTCLGGRCYDTGKCILGCVPGYMNRYCDETCPPNCLNNVCKVNTTITCTGGCKAGYCGTKCTRPCQEEVKGLPISNTVLLILISCVAMSVLIMSLVFLVYVPRQIRRGKKSIKTGNAEEKRLTGDKV